MSSTLLPGKPCLANVARIDQGVIPFVSACERTGISVSREGLWELGEYLESQMKELAYLITAYVPQSTLDEFTEDSLRGTPPLTPTLGEGEEEEGKYRHGPESDLSRPSFNPDSPDQVAELLFRHLGIGKGVELATTASGLRTSTGKKQLEMLNKRVDAHPVLGLILQRRELAKLLNTYAKPLPELAVWEDSTSSWRIFYKIGLTFTSTGRMTCSRLHQIPGNTDLGKRIRGNFIPAPGKVFVSADYSGMEMRVLAHRARERRMMEIFASNGDIHSNTQSKLRMPESMSQDQRRKAAKSCGFGVIFGTSPVGLWTNLQSKGVLCTLLECEGFMEGFFGEYRDTKPYIEREWYRARRYGFAWNDFGRVTLAPEFRSVHRRIVREGERRVQNWGIQSEAGDIFKIAAAKVYEFCVEVEQGLFGRPYYCKPLLPVHDQSLIEVDKEIAKECAKVVGSVMEDAVELRVRLKVDSEVQEKKWTH